LRQFLLSLALNNHGLHSKNSKRSIKTPAGLAWLEHGRRPRVLVKEFGVLREVTAGQQ
jgi:hypothetical protein